MDFNHCSDSLSGLGRFAKDGRPGIGQTGKLCMDIRSPVGQLAEYLEAPSRERIWFAIVAATGAVEALDYALPTVGFTILYMPIICGAAWGLGSREGYFVAIIVAFLTVMPGLSSDSPVVPEILALRAAVRVVTFLSLAGIITSFRRSYDREQFHAHRDRMTGMLNKAVFQRRCAMTIQDAAHIGETLLLAILDLDDFKDVNNIQGHQAGDEVLTTFAEGMSAIMRREDLIGRIGGDEFSLLVRVPSIAEGQSFAHDIHARLSAVLAASRYPVTCSMGALLIPAHAPRDATRLMHEADQAMYRAKRAGKGAIVVDRVEDANMPMIGYAAAQRREGLV